MRKGFLGSLGALLAGAGLALGQSAPAFRPAAGFVFPQAPAVYPGAVMPSAAPPAYAPVPHYAPSQWGYPAQAMPPAAYGYPQPYYRPAVYPAAMNLPRPMPQHLPAAPHGLSYPGQSPRGYPAPAGPVFEGMGPVVVQTPEGIAAPKAPERVPAPKVAVPAPQSSIALSPAAPVLPDGCCEPCPPDCPDDCCDEKKGKKKWWDKDKDFEEDCEKEKKPRACCFWSSADYLVWFFKEGPVAAPLVTTGPGQGALGGGTQVLFGGDGFDFELLNGIRATFGAWIGEGLGVEFTGLFLEEGEDTFQAASGADGTPLLARPFFNSLTGTESSALVSAPGVASGSVAVNATTQLLGAEANLLACGHFDCGFSFNLITGVRYLSLDDDLDILSTSQLQGGGTSGFAGSTLTAPATVSVLDTIDTRNQFLGGQFGMQMGWCYKKVFVAATAKVAAGMTHQSVDILGNTRLVDTGATVPGGLLAQPSNFGRRKNDVFSYVPEGNLAFGMHLSERLSASLGYTFLYWSKVARPGDQLDRTVNPSQVPTSLTFVPGSGAPPNQFQSDRSFWAQGVNAGIAFRY